MKERPPESHTKARSHEDIFFVPFAASCEPNPPPIFVPFAASCEPNPNPTLRALRGFV